MPKVDFGKITKRVNPEDSRFATNRSPFFPMGHMMARYHARMNASLKPFGMDVPRWRVLVTLADGNPLTVSGIADESVVYLSTMAKIINRMATQGLVSTKTSRSDARSIEVTITQEGLRKLESVREKVNHVWNEALRGITKTEAQLLNSLSVRIYGNLSP